MKPEGPVARRRDYVVFTADVSEAREFIIRHHYAKGASKTAVHAHKLFRAIDTKMVGAALWLPPTKPAAKSVGGENWRRVLSLSRLAVSPGEPKNTTGLFLAESMKRVTEDTRWDIFLTYADTRQGHEGTIYKATGWEYLGEVPGSQNWADVEGRQVSALATKTRTVAEMQALGYTRLPILPKHKFVFRVKRD